jgi:hypothetical protein
VLAPVLGVATFLAGVVATVLVDRAYGPGDALWVLIWLGCPLVGGLTAALRPRNPIGWVLLGAGVFGVCSQFSDAYSPGPHPTDVQAIVVAAGGPLLYLGMTLVGILVLLFPTGALDPGWRPRLVKILMVGFVVGSIDSFFIPELSGDAQNYHNPLSLPAWDGLANTVSQAVTLFYVAFLVIAVADAFLRLRRSRGIERQQFKWLAYSSLLLAPAIILASVTPTSWWWSPIPLIVATNGLAASIGVAIVRYRLYDIDRLINRTLAYATVTGLLIGVYVGLVTLATRVLPFSSPLGVAASTLVAVALFNPLRRRVQRLVDRRFNRARYDAEATVSAFAQRVRDDVNLEVVSSEFVRAVQSSVEPSHVSLWLRPTGSSR